MIYTAYRRERNNPLFGRFQRMSVFLLETEPGFAPARLTLSRWWQRFEENGGSFCVDERKKPTSGTYKLSPLGMKAVLKRSRGSNYRRTARDFNFQGAKGELVKISRETVKKYATRGGLVLSLPKERLIRTHFPHHLRLRSLFCRYVSQESFEFCRGLVFSDEMLWPITFGFNKRNDVILVEEGQQKITNIIRRTKGDRAQAFSSFIMIDEFGFVCSKLFTEKFTIDFWHALLIDVVEPAITQRLLDGKSFTASIHDWVTNSGRLFDKQRMDNCFGVGKWFPHTPKICRVEDGYIVIEATKTRKQHNRKRMSPAEICDCKVTQPAYPSASPDLNLAENVQGYLQQLVREKIRRERVVWSGSVKKKMKILQDVINELDTDKAYFRKLLGTVRKRYRWVANNGGAVYDA